MSFSKINANESSIPKWQIALCLGGTIAVGAGLYYYFGQCNKSTSRSKTVRNNSAEISDESPLGKAQSAKSKGNKYFKASKFEQAIKCYDEAIELCPLENKTDLSTFYQNRAAAYEQMKNWENVLRDCTAALNLNNRYVKALQRRAKACEILCDLEQALEDLTTVCIIDSFQNQGNLVNVDRVLKALGSQHAKEAMANRSPFMPSKHYIKSYLESFSEDPILNSLHKEKEGDVDESESGSAKNIVADGYTKAKLYLEEGNYTSIIGCCENELNYPQSPYRAESLLLRATLLFLHGDMKKSIEDLNTLIDMEDVDVKIKVNALIKRGTLFMHIEKIDDCLKDFDRAALQDPQNADIFHHMGQVNLLVGNVDGAIGNFNKAVSLNENFPIAFVQKCYTDYRYAQQKNDKERIDEVMLKFDEAIKNFPKCVECYILYAQVLSDQNEFEKANEQYLKAIEVDPQNPANLVHHALLLLQWKGDLDQSRRLIKSSLELDDKCELAYENLATIEVQTGNLATGVELFNKAIPLAKTEMEMAHLFSLRDAAVAQLKVIDKLGITLPNIGAF